ncbi:MAG: L-threonylcarbamoyladenylate synthase [Armatimonas sp.]
MPVRIVFPTETVLSEAAERLRAGELVAFPTETVYGLGANALDANAVGKIFTAKGRPASNPLIVHVASESAARNLAASWPESAEQLAATYWPGPLTLVVEKTEGIPEIVTAGGSTVGLRVPAHPVALELLKACGLPLAAPSANRSEETSPTTAQHVADSLGPYVDDLLIIDGGPCQVGIESTVVDVTGPTPIVLRPGMISLETAISANANTSDASISRSPGQMLRHYAPRKPFIIIQSAQDQFSLMPTDGLLRLTGNPEEAARRLYAELRRLDTLEYITRIVVLAPPDTAEWAAIHDRLRRAAAS